MAFNRMCIFHRETVGAIMFNKMVELRLNNPRFTYQERTMVITKIMEHARNDQQKGDFLDGVFEYSRCARLRIGKPMPEISFTRFGGLWH